MKKTLEQSIRLVMEQQANAGVLEYGSDIARDTYAKDTPGQTPGVDHSPEQHQHKPNLALDGVPVPGGQLKKPNFEKDAGMGKVAEAKDMKVKNCGCGKDPCETYGSKEEQMKEAKMKCEHCDGTGMHEGKECPKCDGKGFMKEYYDPHHGEDPSDATKQSELDKDRKMRNKMMKHDKKKGRDISGVNYSSVEQRKRAQKKFGEEVEIDEAGRWENTSQGRAYRRLSPEEKARRAKANMLLRKSGAPKSRAKTAKVGIGKLKSVYRGSRLQRNDVMSDLIADLEMAYLGEAMSDSERKQAAAKIFRMHQAKQAAKQANAALGKKSDPAAKAARRDSAGYKTSDDSHLDKKSKAPEKKRGRGERDLPHIVSQLRGVVDTKDGKPSAVKFKDGSTKNVKPKHAAAWLKKHDSAKPADKLSMYKSHDSHSSFKSYAKEAVDAKDKKVLKKLSKDLSGSMAAHMKQKKSLDKAISDEYIPEASKPNNPKLWAAKKAAAKAKFDVYPSAYANGWAAKQYKAAGGTWRSESVEHDLNELSTRTLTNYIQKASNPGDGRSAINQASRGGYKLGKQPPGGDLSAGEKNDRKAFKRGKGIMRAAQKIQRKTYGNMTKPTPYGGSEMSPSLTRKTKKEERMPGQEYRIQMKKVKSKNPAVRKAVSNIYDKKGDIKMNHPDVKAAKKYMGMGEETVNEISAELINKVRQKRSANVVRAYQKYDDYRSPEYKDAVKKSDRNQKLTFRAGAKKADQMAKALQKSVNKSIQKRKELQAKREQQKNT